VQEIDEESESLANISSSIAGSTMYTPSETPSVQSDPSVNANPRHSIAPGQGFHSITGHGQHSPLPLAPQHLLPEDQTISLLSIPNKQQPNIPANPSSKSITSRTSQIPSSSSAHIDERSTAQPRKLPPDDASPRPTASVPPEILKSNTGRVPDELNTPTPMASSRPVLPDIQKSFSQIPIRDAPSPPSNAPKQTDHSVLTKPASVHPSATNILTRGQELITTDELTKANSQPSSSQVHPTSASTAEPKSAPKRRGKVVIKPPERPNSPASFDAHFASALGSMQMVGAEAQEEKKGFRKWVKGKLEKYVG